MPGELDIEKIRWNTFYGFEQDGLNELGFGVLALLMTPIVLLCYRSKAYILLIFVFTALVLLFFKKIFEAIRKRIHVPRTGYAELKNMPWKTRILFGLFNAGSLLGIYYVGYTLGMTDPIETLMPLTFGIMLSGSFVYHYFKSGSRLYLWYAAVALAVGAVSTIIGNDLIDRTFYYLLGAGVFSLVAGIIRLRSFLRNHPKVT